MISDRRKQIMSSLRDEEYRQAFVAEDVGVGLAFQIKLLREDRDLKQEELGHLIGSRQSTISQLENPNYGRYSLETLKQLAAAFDVGLLVKFVPFSELVDWTLNLTHRRLAPPAFAQETLEDVIKSVVLNDSPKTAVPKDILLDANSLALTLESTEKQISEVGANEKRILAEAV